MKCVEVYKELYHQEPFDVAFCPYRISPLGAHIDHQYGKINGLAIDKGIHKAYHPKQNGVVELQSLNFPKRAQFFVSAVPEEKQGKRLFISFQGAESGIALWLNGQFVGYSEDSFTPSEFELTEYVKEGENKLAAQVFKWTASSWCEDQDFYRFSGIYRDVYLYTVPEVHVYDLQIRAVPDETLKSANLEVSKDTWLEGIIKVTLSGKGEILFSEEKDLSGKNTYTWEIPDPVLWSAEDPQLNDLEMEVYDAEGTLQEIIPERVGFRRFEMKDGIMTLNGKRIVFKGVNRHEFSSITGRHVSEEELL